MNTLSSDKLLVSLFQIPEDYRAKLAEIAASSDAINKKTSINACIIEALEDYLKQSQDIQLKPTLPKVPLRAFTVRTTRDMKQKITHCAAAWQLQTSFPVSMNAVVNTAVLAFLQKNIQGYQPPF
ncbi:hypothetical protein [Methylotenera sp.]|uniref:hypothetical protein n=1 Tax=Methylotenera sp. TaxID=2051956 RepID=UPI002728D905|nr:hypothetical protein [Methylotenera sp.]MDO9204062.1 hypothetical protein [Methylotenera sp.]